MLDVPVLLGLSVTYLASFQLELQPLAFWTRIVSLLFNNQFTI